MIIEKNFLGENAYEEKHFKSGFKYNNWSGVCLLIHHAVRGTLYYQSNYNTKILHEK